MVIDVRVASVTFKEVTPTCPPKAAITVTVPGAMPFAQPYEPDELLMVASDGFDEVQRTELVIFWVVPSVSVPVAVKAIDVSSATFPLLGAVIAIAVKPSTVMLAVPFTPPREQVMVAGVAEMDSPVTMFPLTVAMVVSEEVQVTTDVMD